MPKPTIYLIAGCNGAGKTTFAKEFLPHEVKCLRFYNADEIARGLSPLDPSAGAIKAGRLLLNEIRESLNRHETFALESTLSGKTYVRVFGRALSLGYELELHYLWLSDVDQAIARVRQRVRMGGHDVPVVDIRRRFKRSLAHLIDDYLLLATRWVIWDNRGLPAKRLATSASDDVNSVRPLIGLCKAIEKRTVQESRRFLLAARNVRFVEWRARCARNIANLDCSRSSGRTETLTHNQRIIGDCAAR